MMTMKQFLKQGEKREENVTEYNIKNIYIYKYIYSFHSKRRYTLRNRTKFSTINILCP